MFNYATIQNAVAQYAHFWRFGRTRDYAMLQIIFGVVISLPALAAKGFEIFAGGPVTSSFVNTWAFCGSAYAVATAGLLTPLAEHYGRQRAARANKLGAFKLDPETRRGLDVLLEETIKDLRAKGLLKGG